MLIGLISDTHGLLRPEAVAALRGCDRIVHAGDVGRPAVLDELGRLAPTVAVRGNVDTGDWADQLPDTAVVEAAGLRLFVLHRRAALEIDPAREGFAAVVFGHSHVPGIETKAGVLYVNPGAAGLRRFNLPVTVGRLRVAEGRLLPPEILTLDV